MSRWLHVFILFVTVFAYKAGTGQNISENTTGMMTRIFNWQRIEKSLRDLLVLKKNVLASWPLEVLATALDMLCSSTLFFTRVPLEVTPDITKMHFQYMTPCQNVSVPLLEAKTLWAHSSFQKSRKVVILATGWTNTVNDSAAIAMISRAFMCRKDVNFVIVDAAYYVDTLYKWSALNTDLIGEYIARGLTQLIELTPLQNIHLVGHSLGAHIMGTAGREFKKLTGRLIPRITGLDPAKPCFRQTQTLSGLFISDAAFVDIIHTNIGILAKRGPMGHIDFYPGGANALQPGCLTLSCSHSRAVEYFAESAYPGQEHSFIGLKCKSWDALKHMACDESVTSPMGYLVNSTERGIFYVTVNADPPFGKGTTGAVDSTCSLCPTRRN